MDIDALRDYLLAKQGVTEEMPFGPDTLVYKVMGKVFALVPLDSEELTINLKNTPEKNIELREQFEGVLPGFHMNKKHWNTVHFDHSIKQSFLKEWIDESYGLVVAGLPKKLRQDLENLS